MHVIRAAALGVAGLANAAPTPALAETTPATTSFAAAASAKQTPATSTAPAAASARPTPTPTAAQPAAGRPLAPRVLSDERTSSMWAHPARVATIRARPSQGARVVGRTMLMTEVGKPNVYLALAIARDAGGRRWLRIRVPGRPNGRPGWVLRGALGPLHRVDTQLVVDRRTLRATLRRSGKAVFRVPIGIGAPATPTPAGRFWVREKLRFAAQPLYGTHALGTSAYAPTLTEWPAGGVVGLHGTDQPQLIPGRPSHGCVRVRNEQMAKLWRLTPLGTPVLIR